MFKFLKDKLKGAISRISKKAAEEPKEEPKIQEAKQIKEEPQIKEEVRKEEPKPEETFVDEGEGDWKDLEERKIVIDWGSPEEEEQKPEPVKEEKQVFHEKIAEKEIVQQTPKKEETIEKIPEIKEEPKKRGFFGLFAEKITTTKISREKFDSLFSELELIMMENNVAVEVIDKIKSDM